MADEKELTNINDIPGVDTLPTVDAETASFLDKALLEATEGAGEDLGNDAPPADEKKDEKVVEKVVETPVADKVVVPSEIAPEPDELDKVAIPGTLKPKTGEAFAEIKRVAREKIVALSTRTKELETKLAEIETKYKDGGLTEDVKKELAELRGFRSKLDVEADPAFREYDSKVTATTDSIFAKLISAGASQSVVDKIKEIGGINSVDWEPLLAKLPPQTRRFIEQKLVEVEDITERKEKAIKEAKENSQKYVAERQEKTLKHREQATAVAKAYGEKLLSETEWNKPKVAPANATAEQKKEVESYNAFLKGAAQAVAEAAADDSPEMRAALGLGVAELMKTRLDFAAYKASTEAQVAQLTKDLKETTELLGKIKKGSTQRLRETPANSDTAAPKTGLAETGSEAIDRYARELAGGTVPA